jgi:cytochrome c-type biogenesis protein CcmF
MGHVGIAVFGVGVSMTSLYSIETDLRMAPGQTKELAGYQFRFDGVEKVQGPNYIADEGRLLVTRNGNEITTLAAQKREYDSGQMTIMTEAAIDAGVTRDLYFALGESLDDGGAWSMRIYYKPFIRWIWLGAFIMSLGALLAVMDKRYRRSRVKVTSKAPAGAATVVAQ